METPVIKTINWKFDGANYNPDSHKPIPAGDYRVRIETIESQESKSGYEMLKLTLKVNGHARPLYHYLVFMGDSAEHIQRTDNNLGYLFNSFGIEMGDMNPNHWVGKVGAARVKMRRDDKGEEQSTVAYFIPREEQENLPMWQERRSAQIVPEMVNPDADLPPF